MSTTRRARTRRSPEGIRITKVGLWYVLFAVLAAVAATNTGNNALYMVVAVMLAVLVVSGLVSRANVDHLGLSLTVPDEVFANAPFVAELSLTNRSVWMPRWLLLVAGSRSQPRLVELLGRRQTAHARLELMIGRRGRRPMPSVHVASLFPFGFFRKGVRYRLDRQMIVYPELFARGGSREREGGRFGETASRHAGWGHDLHALRAFRPGDDPRSIHWKQTARTGELIYMERSAEESRRLAIVLDNRVRADDPDPAATAERFERLVSEAATVALDALDGGLEVELTTRDHTLGFGSGRRHRGALLELLALVETVETAPADAAPGRREPLRSRDPSAPLVRLAVELPVETTGGRGAEEVA